MMARLVIAYIFFFDEVPSMYLPKKIKTKSTELENDDFWLIWPHLEEN